MNTGSAPLTLVHNDPMDDPTEAYDKAEHAQETLAASGPHRCLRIKPSTFDQMTEPDSTAWARLDQPRAGNEWLN